MIRRLVSVCAATALLTGCHGVFDSIYDEAPTDDTFVEGFHPGDYDGHLVLQLNATSYEEWIYLDLRRLTIERLPIPRGLAGDVAWDGRSGITYHEVNGDVYRYLSTTPTDAQTDPAEWDLAIHHFDVRTNGGSVARTALGAVSEATAAMAAQLSFEPDTYTNSQVIVDLREMMGYHIGYQNIAVNMVLTSWATMDFTTPPPTYAASGATYMLRTADGRLAALRMRHYLSPRGTKGYLTIDIKLL